MDAQGLDALTDPVILVAGPTASGKSALALDLARAFGGTIVNADSMQVYRELRILTARPGAAEETHATHRLYGVMSAAEACSAARWRALAVDEIAGARAAGRVPILVGGTGLYFRALTEGLAPIPPVPAAIREDARARHKRLGGEAFHAELAARDPATAGRLAPGDSQRLIRAREVFDATGVPLAEWQRRDGEGLDAAVLALVLLPPREPLYAACDARFLAMIEAGALDEAAAIAALGLDPALPAMKALGVPELIRHLTGEIALDEAVAAAQQGTRNYAKRQITWFRHQMPGAVVFKVLYSRNIAAQVTDVAREFLLTHKE